MTLLKLETVSSDELHRAERKLERYLVHPFGLRAVNHLTLWDTMLEIALSLRVVRMELIRRKAVAE